MPDLAFVLTLYQAYQALEHIEVLGKCGLHWV